MRKYKFFIIIFSIIVFLTILVTFFFLQSSSPTDKEQPSSNVILVREESYFNDFKISGENVFISCCISIQNISSDTQTIKLIANLPEDVEVGLLSYSPIFAFDQNQDIVREITIPPNSKLSYIDVVFKGKYGGNPIKTNRLLPDISILEN